MLTYLERNGSYRQHRELGLVAWMLGHIMDAASAQDHHRMKEMTALLLVAVEQAVVDRGDWGLLHAHSSGRASFSAFPRQSIDGCPPHETLRATCSSTMDCSLSCIPEGHGNPGDQERRNSQEAGKDWHRCRAISGGRTRKGSVATTQASLPEEAQGFPRNMTAVRCSSGPVDVNEPAVSEEPKIKSNSSCVHLPPSGCTDNPSLPKRKTKVNSCKGSVKAQELMVGSTLNFNKWCSFLTSTILRIRSSFSFFLLATLHLPRDDVVSASPAFPLPVPNPGIFAKMPSGLSATKRRRLHFRRALHCVVMALNFWWCGSCSVNLEHLRRVPSPSQRLLLGRISGLMLADGPSESFETITSGRRFPQLIARLAEVSDAVTKLGVGAGPYEKVYPGHDVEMDNTRFPELEPYRSLNASRLKIVGTGSFDATEFLSPELAMAYRCPDTLLFAKVPQQWEYPQRMDDPSEVTALAKVWDARGLLAIHDVDIQSARPFEMVKVFNCLKNAEVDRQIGDRRGRNSVEQVLHGPSRNLPTGPDLLDLFVDAKTQTLSICCTDRRDFYHQFAVSDNRMKSNTVGPRAYKDFCLGRSKKAPPRSIRGDQLGESDGLRFPRCKDGECMIAFRSILQGDHAGVEIATSSHEGLLKSIGLLDDVSRVVSGRPFFGTSLMQGLVIDDFFAIAVVPKSCLVDDPALEVLKRCKKVYETFGLLGSDDKDIVSQSCAKIIGATINAGEQALMRGHVLVPAATQKRYALSWLTLQLAQLGGWTSVLMHRRPFMSILQRSFSLVDMGQFDVAVPKLVRFSRPIVTELVLLSVLTPLIVTDIAVDFAQELYATDASMHKGAILRCPISRAVSETLWKSCRSKGGYSKLLSPTQSILSRAMDYEEEDPLDPPSVSRPIAYRFDFIEVFAGSSKVTKQVSALGMSVGPPIDISFSQEYDLSALHVLEWLAYLVSNRLIKAFMLEPPCTTHSVMRRPPLRSRDKPYGFNPHDPHTRVGTMLALRAFQLFALALFFGITCILENPWSSKIKYLPPWDSLVRNPHCTVVRCDSCAYGSPHLKAFVFLCAWAAVDFISKRCTGDHVHVPVEGHYTKLSATYVDSLAFALARTIECGVRRQLFYDHWVGALKVDGLENQLINEVTLSSSWEPVACWTFKVPSHINILELISVVRMVEKLVRKGTSARITVIVDSNVVRCAGAKGRSSAKALGKILRRLAVLCVVGGIYLVFGFIPTRHNPADDPTRDVKLRTPVEGMDIASWSLEDLQKLAMMPRLKRWASNWIRLVLLLLGPSALDLKDRWKYRSPQFPFGFSRVSDLASVACSHMDFSVLDFDSSLGYPGEGPLTLGLLYIVSWISFSGPVGSHGVLLPRNAGDLTRQRARGARPPLQEGRPVLGVTAQHRQSFLTQLEEWLRALGYDMSSLLDNHVGNMDLINDLLVRYGRNLYAVGRPYNHFAETINAVASRKLILKRQLQAAWNLAFAWVRDEPSVHHIAMPWQILLASISICLTWGWLDVAGMFALCWGSLLRVGEFVNATRADLLLPADTNFTNAFALLSLKEPKTRFTAARHQGAKLDIPDLLRVVELAFQALRPHQRLWAKSGQTLRSRFRQVMHELMSGRCYTLNGKTLDLGSLRPGGATWILQTTEDGEFCRRRGRWINQRVMEIYIHEVSSFQYLSILPSDVRQKIFTLCDYFLTAVSQAFYFQQTAIPTHVWYIVWSRQVSWKQWE